MNIYQVEELLKQNCSRGFVVEGMYMLRFHVPKKSVKDFMEVCRYTIPAPIDCHVLPLNTTAKKGTFAVVSHFNEKSQEDGKKKFPKIFKKV